MVSGFILFSLPVARGVEDVAPSQAAPTKNTALVGSLLCHSETFYTV